MLSRHLYKSEKFIAIELQNDGFNIDLLVNLHMPPQNADHCFQKIVREYIV